MTAASELAFARPDSAPILWIEDQPNEPAVIALRQRLIDAKLSRFVTLPLTRCAAIVELVRRHSTQARPPSCLLLDWALNENDPAKADAHAQVEQLLGSDDALRKFVKKQVDHQDNSGKSVLSVADAILAKTSSVDARPALLPVLTFSRYGASIRKEFEPWTQIDIIGVFAKGSADSLANRITSKLEYALWGMPYPKLRASLGTAAESLLGPEGSPPPQTSGYLQSLTDLAWAGQARAVHPAPASDRSLVIQAHKLLPRALVIGERGSGKERYAKALHDLWHRGASQTPAAGGRAQVLAPPFRSVNAGAWSDFATDSLLIELFGGGNRNRVDGLFTLADRGTLFIDELGDCPKSAQNALIRAVEEGEFTTCTLGQPQRRYASVCLIGATNRLGGDRPSASEEFRADLVDRFAGWVIRTSPLREMLDDLGFFAQRILVELANGYGELQRPGFPVAFADEDKAVALLKNDTWPDNLRGLRQLLKRAGDLCLEQGRSRIPTDFVEWMMLKRHRTDVLVLTRTALTAEVAPPTISETAPADAARRSDIASRLLAATSMEELAALLVSTPEFAQTHRENGILQPTSYIRLTKLVRKLTNVAIVIKPRADKSLRKHFRYVEDITAEGLTKKVATACGQPRSDRGSHPPRVKQ